ncbi:MAG: hypothetical protein JXD23_10460 [Spirochaetales bacterium]|nr:hypothetical protein [Spirochaetales bacterium]
MTLTITEKNQDVVKELGIDDASRTLVYALDVDRGEFASYRYEIMDQAMEDRAWDVPLDKDPPVLHFTSEMRAGNPEAFTDDAVRQKFDDLLKKLSGIPRTAEHTVAFGPSRLTPDLGEVRAEFYGRRTQFVSLLITSAPRVAAGETPTVPC